MLPRPLAAISPNTANDLPRTCLADDEIWGLFRASSNKPELVVVVESPVSDARMRAMFVAIDGILRENTEVGDYNQSI